MGERRLGEHVVGEALRELGQGVCRARCDDEQIGAGEVRVEVSRRRPARQREERLLRDEPLCTGRQERDHLVARLDEQARQLACLVGRDTACYTEQDLRHRRIVPGSSPYLM